LSEKPAIERCEDATAWDAFAARTSGAHVFLTSAWHAAWNTEPERHVLRDRAGEIVAGVSLLRGRWLGGDAVRRPPLTPYGHPIIDAARLSDPVRRHAAVGALLDHLGGFRSLDFPASFDVPALTLPYIQRGFECQLGISYVLRARDAAVWTGGIGEGHRRHAKKATREADASGWTVAPDGSGEELWPLLQLTAEEKGYTMSLDASRFARAASALTERGMAQVWMVRDAQRQPLAGTLLVQGATCAHYLAGGLRRDLRRGSSINYLLFKSMITATLERGLDFDFEGSSIPGVEQFFRGWGGEACTVMRQIRMRPALLHALASTARRRSRRRRGVSSGSAG